MFLACNYDRAHKPLLVDFACQHFYLLTLKSHEHGSKMPTIHATEPNPYPRYLAKIGSANPKAQKLYQPERSKTLAPKHLIHGFKQPLAELGFEQFCARLPLFFEQT